MAKDNLRKLKPKAALSDVEVRRCAERIATEMEHNEERIGLLVLLLDHFEAVAGNNIALWDAIYTTKTHVTLGLGKAEEFRDGFSRQAFSGRGKLLRWPSERGAK